MDILTAEENLALWLEETTGMTDKVFRLSPPPGVYEGFAVKLVSGVPAGPDRVNEFTVEIRGISPDRGELWNKFNALFAALPGENRFGFLYMDIRGPVTFSMAEKEGLQIFCGTVNLTVSFV